MRVLLAGVVALACGCNMISLMAPEPKTPASFRRIASDRDRLVKLVIVAYTGLETRPELSQADRQITEMLAKQLRELFENNKERVTIIPPRKVEDYKNSHPDWHQDLDPARIGKHFGADYVAFLDVNHLSLYEKGSINQMYRGQADITVTLVDVNRKEDNLDHKDFSYTYPGEAKGPVPVSDVSLSQFRQSFFDALTRRLSWFFTAHPKDLATEME